MTTESVNKDNGLHKTVVTNKRADDTPIKIEEGCGREPMYGRRYAYGGVREEMLKDSKWLKDEFNYD